MSIAEQVKMLMQENDDATEIHPVVYRKDKKKQVGKIYNNDLFYTITTFLFNFENYI